MDVLVNPGSSPLSRASDDREEAGPERFGVASTPTYGPQKSTVIVPRGRRFGRRKHPRSIEICVR